MDILNESGAKALDDSKKLDDLEITILQTEVLSLKLSLLAASLTHTKKLLPAISLQQGTDLTP